MFDMRRFVLTNLINGFRNGSFTREQVGIYAVNYVARGWLTEGDIIEIQGATEPDQPETNE